MLSYTPPIISFLYGALKMRNQSVVSITNHLWQLGWVLVITSNARSGKLGKYVALCHDATFTLQGTEQMRYRPCCVWRTPTTKQLFLFTPWTAYHVWEIIKIGSLSFVLISMVWSNGIVIFQFLFSFWALKIWDLFFHLFQKIFFKEFGSPLQLLQLLVY